MTDTLETIKDNLQNEIIYWSETEFKNIEREKRLNKNLSLAFGSLGGLGELFTLMLYPNSIGSSSKGGCAFDNKEYDSDGKIIITREVKFISLDGSKICNTCKKVNPKGETKVPRFQTKCLLCNDSNFDLPSDSRWGLSAGSHIKYFNDTYKLNEYILYVSKYDEENDSINLKCFKIYSKNRYFGEYIRNQAENGSGDTCNLIPYSWDFHLSGPIKLFDINICSNGKIIEHMWNLDNETIENVPKELLIKNKKYCDYDINSIETDSIEYKEIINHCKMKKKALGKKRGTTNRK